MASASGSYCGVCEAQDVVKAAAFWCPECNEGICTSCEKHHRASRGTRKHEVTSMDDYKQIPPIIASINQYCPEHDKKYQLYCSQHEQLCCPLCITTNHKKCDLLAIDEIVKTSRNSALFEIMEQNLKEMKNNIDRIVEDRRQNLEIIKQQRQGFQTDIKEMRAKINIHLDKLEQEIQQDLQAAEQKVMSQINRFVQKVSDHEKTIDELQNNIAATKRFATDLQTFFGGKMFEAKIQEEEKFMTSLIEDSGLQQIHLQCKLDNKMSDILSMTKIGEISVTTKSPTISMTTDREKQAQKRIPTISKTINDINLTILKTIEISEGKRKIGITGCTIMPSGKMVFVDQSNDRLVIHNDKGLFDCEIPVSHFPLDVTSINENTVAVTHNAEPYQIEIINIVNKKIVNEIKTSNKCYGITNENERLIYYEVGRGIQIADVKSESTATTVVKVDGKHNWNYVATSNDRIYHTINQSNTVTCYTITGQKVWEYKDESILKSVRGVAVDNDSNVYVVSYEHDSIVVLSPDGKRARRLLAKENGIQYPSGIYFDKGRNILMLTNFYGPASLYEVK
ncbi:unnamed protein product [Mytilus edulis]|uniref:B box-type domain-containing protein n=1 Tax=Mytilus edulis TaxID=6550 RepID=A0A8S3VDC3_MYTED|nr:unnamed protein product [Mytilus edulis]